MVVTYHDTENRPKGGICVANHTTAGSQGGGGMGARPRSEDTNRHLVFPEHPRY